ncbi:MAG TPA: SemiSWEET transporter [Syntrophorhabdaceae bacterium]|nr:SemiSWEET transporter [Syntrophorhabdaceae bacterium]
MNNHIIGYVAAFLTTFAGIPQIVRLLKLRESRDISLATALFLGIGVLLWLIYGLAIGDRPLIAANSISLCISAATVLLVLRYR